jgi:hypothetical protein
MTSMSAAEATADPRSSLATAITGLVTVWAAVLGHECAHFAVGRLVYSPTDLATGHLPTTAHVATVAAGPIFTLLTVVGSALLVDAVRTWRTRLILSTVIGCAASRLLLTAPPTLLGRGGNDEQTLGTLTGVSPRLLWSIEVAVVVWSIIAVARHWPVRDRRSTALWVIIALVVGWATAIPLGRAAGLPI